MSATTPPSAPCTRSSWPSSRPSSNSIYPASSSTISSTPSAWTRSSPTYNTWDELLEYSHYSANPVGRLVLLVCGYKEESTALLSDKVCTALQLANFWQDVVEDAERGRRYLPAEYMLQFGVDEGQILGRVFTPEFRAMIESLVIRTRDMLREGGNISVHVSRELAVTLDLFRKGGDAILDGITAQDFDVLRGRPVVSKAKKLSLLAGALFSKLSAELHR